MKIFFDTVKLLNREVDTFPYEINSIQDLIQYAWKINRFDYPFGIECVVINRETCPKPKVLFYTECPQVANKINEDFNIEPLSVKV